MLQEIPCCELMPDVVSSGSGISACEKGKLYEEVLGLLRKIMSQLLTPEVVS